MIRAACFALSLTLIPALARADEGGTPAKAAAPLPLKAWQPRSMLQLPATDVARARFPVIDFHTHVNDARGRGPWPAVPPDKLVAAMDATNVRSLVVLTGGSGEALQRIVDGMVRKYPGRFYVFTQVDWTRIDEPDFATTMVSLLRDSAARGARGLKVLKDLGLQARDKAGRLIAVDDPRLDPIWRTCGELGFPVAIHTSDPAAFFTPVDEHNERYDELQANPKWSFVGGDYPSKADLLAARDRVFARHRKTTFVALHVGNWPENLDAVSQMLRSNPNVLVEIGARQAELGRQPRRARRFFLEFADRIMFGTDSTISERSAFGADMWRNHFRWLETADESFDYWGAPSQGRWKVYGLDLPKDVLRKVYFSNAERVLSAKR